MLQTTLRVATALALLACAAPRATAKDATVTKAPPAKAAAAKGGRPWAEQGPDDTLNEVVASLEASSIARVSLDRYALAGLDALADREPCFGRKLVGATMHLTCDARSVEGPWPPASSSDVASLLTNAVRIVDPQHVVAYTRVKAVARALANAVGDPYTGYLPPELVAKGTASSYAMNGSAGIEVQAREPTRVRAVAPLSDADQEGLVDGDRIVSVDGMAAKDLTYTELSFKLFGPVDSTLRLVVDHRGVTRKIVVARQAIQATDPVTAEIEGGPLYVRIPSWNPGVARRITAALWENRAQGVVVDLRHNGGGRIDEAVALADAFLRDGRIAGVRAGQGRPSHDWDAHRDQNDVTSPLVVLIDGGSGSASELFAMVMKERARATILGAQSLGKGSVQELIKLPDGGFLKVSVGYYVGPSGRRLDEGGVRPDRWLAKPVGRTVLQGGAPADDAWVLSAVDVLRGPLRADSGARAFGPMP